VAGYKSAVLAHNDARLRKTHRSKRSKLSFHMVIYADDIKRAILLRTRLQFDIPSEELYFCPHDSEIIRTPRVYEVAFGSEKSQSSILEICPL